MSCASLSLSPRTAEVPSSVLVACCVTGLKLVDRRGVEAEGKRGVKIETRFRWVEHLLSRQCWRAVEKAVDDHVMRAQSCSHWRLLPFEEEIFAISVLCNTCENQEKTVLL